MFGVHARRGFDTHAIVSVPIGVGEADAWLLRVLPTRLQLKLAVAGTRRYVGRQALGRGWRNIKRGLNPRLSTPRCADAGDTSD